MGEKWRVERELGVEKMVYVRARIKLSYLPPRWGKVVKKAASVADEQLCTLRPEDFRVSDGLVFEDNIGNACVDDVLKQIDLIAKMLGGDWQLLNLDY